MKPSETYLSAVVSILQAPFLEVDGTMVHLELRTLINSKIHVSLQTKFHEIIETPVMMSNDIFPL